MSKKTNTIPNAEDHPPVAAARQKLEKLRARRSEIDAELKRAHSLGIDTGKPEGPLPAYLRNDPSYVRDRVQTENAREQRERDQARAYAEGGTAALAELPAIDVGALTREAEVCDRAIAETERELAEARRAAAEELGATLDSRRRELIAAVGATLDAHFEARRELAAFEAEAERAGCKPTRWRSAAPKGQSLHELGESRERWHKERSGVDPSGIGVGSVGTPCVPNFGSGK